MKFWSNVSTVEERLQMADQLLLLAAISLAHAESPLAAASSEVTEAVTAAVMEAKEQVFWSKQTLPADVLKMKMKGADQ